MCLQICVYVFMCMCVHTRSTRVCVYVFTHSLRSCVCVYVYCRIMRGFFTSLLFHFVADIVECTPPARIGDMSGKEGIQARDPQLPSPKPRKKSSTEPAADLFALDLPERSVSLKSSTTNEGVSSDDEKTLSKRCIALSNRVHSKPHTDCIALFKRDHPNPPIADLSGLMMEGSFIDDDSRDLAEALITLTNTAAISGHQNTILSSSETSSAIDPPPPRILQRMASVSAVWELPNSPFSSSVAVSRERAPKRRRETKTVVAMQTRLQKKTIAEKGKSCQTLSKIDKRP